MASKVSYNLSNVPGFDNFVKTCENKEEFDKYYSVNKYSTKANELYSIIRYNKEFKNVKKKINVINNILKSNK